MDSKHAILWPVIISLVVHLTLITATGAIDLRQNIPDMEILAVSLEELYSDIPYQEENEWVNEKTQQIMTMKTRLLLMMAGVKTRWISAAWILNMPIIFS